MGVFVTRRLVADGSTVNKLEYGGETSRALGNSGRDSNGVVEREQDDHYLDEQEIEKDAARLIEALRKLEDAVPILGSGLVKDPTQRVGVPSKFRDHRTIISVICRRNGVSR